MVADREIEQTGCLPVTFDQLLPMADILSLHCPSNAETRRMIDREVLAKLKPGRYSSTWRAATWSIPRP